jgi:tight adherence protein B
VRRAGLLACAAAALAALSASPALAANARLTPAGGPAFPQRAFVLTLPAGATVGGGGVHVYENGQPVTHLSVRSASDRFAVMLVIDASTSMRGAPIRGAMAAARAFAQQRPANQPLGVVTFNDAPNVILSPTRDRAAIEKALTPLPELRRGTHIYDALSAALRPLTSKQFDASAVVLLSDGHDYGSSTTFEQVLTAAQKAHVKLFTIGLRSTYFDPSTLIQVAQQGHGEYVGAATPKDVTSLYEHLGGQLSAAYSIRYLSSAPAASNVTVTADFGAEQAVIGYAAPQLHVAGAIDGRRRIVHSKPGFLGTTSGAIVVSGLVLLLAMVGLSALASHRRREALRHRLSDYGADQRAATMAVGDLATRAASARPGFMVKLDADRELGRLHMSTRRYLLECAGIAGLAALFALALTRNGVLAVVVLVVGWPVAARLRARRAVARQRKLFAEQLADSVEAAASAMRTGHSFAGALSQMVETAPEPTAGEFRRVIADERLGVPLETALGHTVERMRSKHLQQVSLVTVIQRETGGNGAEALDRVVENIRAGDDLRRLMRTLTAQGRTAQAILTALPILTAIFLKVVGGSTMDPLFESNLGHVALVTAALMVALGGVWIGRIIKIRV